jgi:excisionase family DNA binding protein
MAIMEVKYYTVDQIAETLSIGTRSVMNLVRSGELPAYQFRSEVRIRPGDFDKFLQQARIKADSANREIGQ